MAQTLQNQLLMSKSMNGIITFDDGAGTVISDGVVSTDSLVTDTMASTNMNSVTMTATNVFSDNVIVPRINTALIPYLDATINLTTFVQNMNFSDNNRNFVMNSDDNAFGELLNFDCSNNEFFLYPNIMHITPVSTLDINSPNISFTDSNVTFAYSSIDLYPFVTAITINNYGFTTPAQSLNNFSTITSPYSAITGWTITLVSGTAPSVFVGRGFTSLVNLYDYAFPEYPYFTQYVSFQAPSIYQMRFTQSLTFATTGNYILTFYIWGEYNRYSPTNNISVSCGNNSISNFPAVEGAWKKVIMKFRITTAGSNTLTILVNNTSGTDSGISFSGLKIEDQSGILVYDGGNTNNQLITTKGIYSSGFINNQGNILNYGNFINYGFLNVVAPYSAGTLVIGSSLYGTTNADSGRYSTLIGSQVVANGGYSPVNLDSCVFIGYAAGEQAITGIRNHGIGYQSNRWAQNSSCYDNVGYGYSSNSALGYAGGSNCFGNVSIGNFTMSGAYASNNFLNTVIGHGSLSGVDFSNSKSCNTICGANSLQVLASGFNSSLGYNNANGIINTASNGNVFIGTNVCNTQDGSGNILQSCTFIGSDSNVSVAGNYLRSSCIGYNSRITGSDQIVLGTSSQKTYAMGGLTIPVSTNLNLLGSITTTSPASTITPTVLSYISTLSSNAQTQITDISNNYLKINPVTLTIANKINLATNQTVTGTTVNLSFSTAENILLTDATTTTINLPTPNVDGRNEGCKFNIYRKVTGVTITINPPSGQTLSFYQSNATYISAGSYFLNAGNGSITVLCIGSSASGTNWEVLPPSISQGADNIYLGTTYAAPAGTALSIPFGGITTAGYQPMFMDNTNLSYTQSTATLKAANIYSTTESTGDMTVRANLKVNLNFLPYEVTQLLSTATVLPDLPTLYGLYTFVSGASATTIVLPSITADIVGCQLSFRRVSNTTSALIIKTPSGSGQTIVQRASIAETAAFTDYTLLSTSQYYGTIVAITTTKWSALG